MIKMLASAVKREDINPRAWAALNKTKPNSPHCAKATDSRAASGRGSPPANASSKTMPNFRASMTRVLNKSGAQAEATVSK